MLQLTVDGQQVNLNPSCSFEIVKANPLLTKIGEYTYDIDVDLRDPQNAKVYKHINRLHSLSHFAGRTAVLKDGARVICRGTEVLLEIEGPIAKIQILAGNSNFNYLIGGDKKIRDLNFGTMPNPTRDMARRLTKSFYPDSNFGFPEMRLRTESGIDYANEQYTYGFYSNELEYIESTIKPQPYVLYYVEKIIELLGYRLGQNYLREDPRWQRLIIVDAIWSLEYAKHLPDWTIFEFIEEIEGFFNCIFLLDSLSGTVHILSLKTYYSSSANVTEIHSSDVFGHFSKLITSDTNDIVDTTNISYDLPDNDYFKYADLDPEIEERCIISTIDLQYKPGTTPSMGDYSNTIYQDRVTKEFFAYNYVKGGSVFNHVNQFKGLLRDEQKNLLKLRIVPCELGLGFRQIEDSVDSYYLVPKSLEYADVDNDEKQTLADLISNGVKSVTIHDRMEVCFYLGKTAIRDGRNNPKPIKEPYKDLYVTAVKTSDFAFIEGRFISYLPEECGGVDHMTLSLTGEHGRVNKDFSLLLFNSDEEYTICFRSRKMLDPMNLYNIDGRLFYCKELRYKVTNGKFSDIVEGKFYPAVFDE